MKNKRNLQSFHMLQKSASPATTNATRAIPEDAVMPPAPLALVVVGAVVVLTLVGDPDVGPLDSTTLWVGFSVGFFVVVGLAVAVVVLFPWVVCVGDDDTLELELGYDEVEMVLLLP